MLIQLIVTSAVMLGLMLVYYVVQRGLHRVSPEIPEDCDLLEERWGCNGCALSSACDLNHDKVR